MDTKKSRLSKAVIVGIIASLVILILLWPYSFLVHPAITPALGIITGIFVSVITYLILDPKREKEKPISIVFICASLVLFYIINILFEIITETSVLKINTETFISNPIFIYVLAQLIPFLVGAGAIFIFYIAMKKLK